MKVPELPPEGGRMFAVLDPHCPRSREMISALGTDAVELRSSRVSGPDLFPVFSIRISSLTPGRLLAVCRLLARRHGMSLDRAMVEAVQGRGIAIPANCCYVCGDPEKGRAFFATWDRAGGS